MLTTRSMWLAAALGCATLTGGDFAQAHPHVLPTVRLEIVVDNDRVAALRQTWVYDQAYSAFALRQLDSNQDGNYSEAELAVAANQQTDSFAEFGYYTGMEIDGRKVAFDK